MPTSSASATTTVSVVVVGTIVLAPVVFRAIRYVHRLLFGTAKNTLEQEGLKVFVKTKDKTVAVQMSPEWNIAKVKSHLAGVIGKDAEELRIIVAGHELRDDVKVGDCDLGESTVIHAVKVANRTAPLPSIQNVVDQQEAFEKDLEDIASTSTSHNTKINSKLKNLKVEKVNPPNNQVEGDQPMNACLLDLQLTENERIMHDETNMHEIGEKASPDMASNDHIRGLEQESKAPQNSQERKKAHFWVYCSEISCGRTIQPGKLRVRCETCRGGAIIVTSDPCSWEDVLNPHRISGYCQNSSCPNEVGDISQKDGEGVRLRPVQFYFKCHGPNHNRNYRETTTASYEANDFGGEMDYRSSAEAPPLFLIRSNLRYLPCLACGDSEVNPVLVFGCLDQHIICISCFRDYCISSLNHRSFTLHSEFGYTLGCPVGCKDSYISAESKHFTALLTTEQDTGNDDNQYDRYQRFATEEFVLQSGGVLCPQPNCGMGIMPQYQSDAASDTHGPLYRQRKVACEECRYVFCRLCLQGYHLGNCEDIQETDDNINANFASLESSRLAGNHWVSRARWISDETANRVETSQITGGDDSSGSRSSWVAIRVTTKPCPKCRTPTERAGGCMHMECTKAGCGFQWCWVCQTEWTRNCMASHWFG